MRAMERAAFLLVFVGAFIAAAGATWNLARVTASYSWPGFLIAWGLYVLLVGTIGVVLCTRR